MESKEDMKKRINVCRCCLNEDSSKELSAVYFFDGQTEIYGDMLMECFDVCISQHTEGPSGPKRHICEICIIRLRDAVNFKKQVQECERKFVDMLARGDFRTDAVDKKEPKEEPLLPLDDTFDDFGDDTDEEPLLHLKNRQGSVTALPPTPALQQASLNIKVEENQAMTSSTLPQGKRLKPSKRRRRNLEILFNNTTVIPFKWKGCYLCFYCGTTAKIYDELRRHTKLEHRCSAKDHELKSVNSGEYEIKLDVSNITCELCNQTLPDLKNTIEHLNEEHRLGYDVKVPLNFITYKLSDLSCLKCGESFTFFRNLVHHTNVKHPENVFICDKCSQSFNKRRDLATHIKNYHLSKYKCDECTKVFSSNLQLRSHNETEHLQTCNVCYDQFTSSAKKLKHIDEVHLNSGVPHCKFCKKKCRARQAFLQHINRCKLRLKGDTKRQGTISLVDADEKRVPIRIIRKNLACIFNMTSAIPFKFYMNKFRCFFCTADFHDPEELKQHTRTEHPVCNIKHKSMKLRALSDMDIKIDVAGLKCKICCESIPDLDSLIEHLTAEHKVDYDKSVNCKIVPFVLNKDDTRCPFCEDGESFKFFGNVLKHMNSAHSNNHLVCVYCGKTFRTDANLRSHISRRHKPGKLRCVECDLVFKTSDVLKVHSANVHGRKVMACSKCPEKFFSPYLKKKHMITAHGVGFPCSHCGKMFTGNAVLREHIRRTHLKEKKVECQLCHARFFDKFMLKTHMVRHDGNRRFHCDRCGRKFLWKKNLINHMTTHEKHGRSEPVARFEME